MIPFLIVPLKLAKKVAKTFYGLNKRISYFFPFLELQLKQSKEEMDDATYIGVILLNSLVMFVLLFILFYLIFTSYSNKALAFSFLLSVTFSILSFFYALAYPRLIVERRRLQINKDLLFALRHIIIKLRSGVPLYDTLVSISSNDYGLISEEFKDVIKMVNTGKSLDEALEVIVRKNPSKYFRKVVWQMINSIRAGVNIADSLSSIEDMIVKEQLVMLRKYGAELNTFALLYMMFSIILPSLGVTFLIVISSATSISIPYFIFYLTPLLIGIFQFMLVGMVRARRPLL